MITTADFKTGMTILYNNNIYQIMDFQHVKPGKGQAFVKTKLRNLRTGATTDYSFNAGEKLEQALIEKRKMQYLYSGDTYCFMDMETYDQVPFDRAVVADIMKYIKDDTVCTIKYANGKLISIDPPTFIELDIVECEPAVAGNTSGTAYKPAKCETGLVVKVPLFVNNGERIRVDTRTGEYMERV